MQCPPLHALTEIDAFYGRLVAGVCPGKKDRPADVMGVRTWAVEMNDEGKREGAGGVCVCV